MIETELVIDWPAWAERARQLVFPADASLASPLNTILGSGVRLSRRLETCYEEVAGMQLRIGTNDCFRRSFLNFSHEEGEAASSRWWVEKVQELYLYALLSPLQGRRLGAVRAYLADAPATEFWLNAQCCAYVPDDKFFEAYCRAMPAEQKLGPEIN